MVSSDLGIEWTSWSFDERRAILELYGRKIRLAKVALDPPIQLGDWDALVTAVRQAFEFAALEESKHCAVGQIHTGRELAGGVEGRIARLRFSFRRV